MANSLHPVLQSVAVTGDLHGLLLEMRVEQHYANPGDCGIEAVYTFPVPWRAVILGMEVAIGDRVLHAEVAPKASAGQQYEAAIEEGDAAFMLERGSEGLYTVNAGNMLPGETATVRVRYAVLLSFEQGQVRIVVPSVIAPRYGSPAAAGLRHHQVPVHDVLAEHALCVKVRLHGAVGEGRLQSPTHPVAMRRGEGYAEISLATSAFLDRDVVFVADELQGRPLSAVGRDGDGTVVLASFCPALEERAARRPLSMKILVDCSASMNGDSIASARRALHEILSHLEPDDRFSFSRFGGTVVHEIEVLTPATAQALRHAAAWIARTHANLGGTAIGDALESTFALAQPGEADVLLITDGHVWDAGKLIQGAHMAGQRIFAIGIGAAPASSLLHELATRTGGACELVATASEIEAAIVRMVHRMRQPGVQDLAVGWDAPHAWQVDPDGAVFSGGTVHVFAGFGTGVPAEAEISWDQHGIRHRDSVGIGALADGMADTLARVAAAARLRGADDAAQLQLALKYQLVTEKTSLVVAHRREAAQRATELPELRVVPQMAPAGFAGVGQPAKRAGAARKDGSETYDMPAFLRKQADDGWQQDPGGIQRAAQARAERDSSGSKAARHSPAVWRRESASEQVKAMLDFTYTHRDTLKAFANAYAGTRGYPASLDDIAGGLPGEVLAQLRRIAAQGNGEADIVRAFIEALHALMGTERFARCWRRRLFGWGRRRAVGKLVRRIATDAYHAGDPMAGNGIPAFLRRQAD